MQHVKSLRLQQLAHDAALAQFEPQQLCESDVIRVVEVAGDGMRRDSLWRLHLRRRHYFPIKMAL